MAYSANLGSYGQLAIANREEQTQINLSMSIPGQQQSQSSSFSTGKWLSKPKLFQLKQGFVLAINTTQNSHYILIQQNSISTIESPPELNRYPQIDLTAIAQESNFAPMQPMQPMQPLRMGNMSMQMGNMSMSLNNQSKTSISKQFCSQCGKEAQLGDRFCRSCGHELNN
ncbi:zinc ribbon domain-containing protein [Pleurocapsa sp. CCALA 161]|uniref:zinc ribbon domain-containing protein n=1 Tax=Pleurocapsa sp. CCALA 161 TaxID=2107688 RepID=UPI000D05DB3E|nr:zinc ribbon domain-containing protein [Pleurocapsa sp. CCALA 161]PSB09274.1 zinc ribbon domain-containing protein [Pleurocapsa sp. CCALA 161]